MSIDQSQDPIVAHHLGFWTQTPPSDVGIRVAKLLDEWGGLHHFDERAMKKADWSNPYCVELKLSKHTSTGQLSSFDFSHLTRLVFLAHDHCIRVYISPCNATHLILLLHPRPGREGDISRRHPTLEQAVADWRQSGQHVDRLATPIQEQ